MPASTNPRNCGIRGFPVDHGTVASALGGGVQIDANQRVRHHHHDDEAEYEFWKPLQLQRLKQRLQLAPEDHIGRAQQCSQYDQNGQGDQDASHDRPQPASGVHHCPSAPPGFGSRKGNAGDEAAYPMPGATAPVHDP